MSLSTAVPTVTKQWNDGHVVHMVGTVAIGASPLTYQAGGLVMSFAGLPVGASSAPLYCAMKGIAGFKYEFNTGTTIANGLLLIRVEATVATNTPLAEHSTAAIVAGVSGDTIRFYAIFAPFGR